MTGKTIPPLSPVPGHSSAEDCQVRLNADSLHDLLSPVNQMCTMTDLILTKHRDTLDVEAEVLVGFMRKAANRLQHLLAGLRTYMAVAGSLRSYRHCDANALLAAAVASTQHAIDANGAVVTHDSLPELWCDPSQMIYTFAGLIENSIRFRREPRPEIHVSANSDGNGWLFSVCDNGIGIDPRYSERIFGVFKRIDNEASAGQGVGLAIARQIIEQHGGRIWVESKPGFGATFLFTLPRDAL